MASPEPGDRRFAAKEWRENPYYDYLKQSYLLAARYLDELVEAAVLEPQAKERVRFAARQWIDAMCPANFPATNPDALREALATRGESLTRGLANLLGDVQKRRISQTNEAAFEVGRNLAVTPGDVVFENELIQLIQYKPATAQVATRPLVMIPPCINKFYILDLQPENSFVAYAVAAGHTVFMVSWRNVEAAQGQFGWDDYLEDGVFAALRVAKEIAKSDQVNALGFCVGGTLLGAALAVLSQKKSELVASATFLAAMLDFSEPGQIGLFVDEASVAAREATIGAGGILPGQDLAFVFSSLRANDLVWPYVVNNYLRGGQPAAFDLLYWNADSTNLPGPMYCYYLRNTYLQNRLREPGALTNCGVAIDLGKREAADLRARHARGPHRAVARRLPNTEFAGRKREAISSSARAGTSPGWSIPRRKIAAATGLANPIPTIRKNGCRRRMSSRGAGGRSGRSGSASTAAAATRRRPRPATRSTSRSSPRPGAT